MRNFLKEIFTQPWVGREGWFDSPLTGSSAFNSSQRLDENSLRQVRRSIAQFEVGGGSIKNSREKVHGGMLL
ncbi:hypothetical protein NPIL_348091 [Nephila pilipes]|uniref:Uncharacterized protein n=1 Tax=Nephila pilipes TaxID=299642 RepID=A0A8X6M986_NEPPI|nr:hypothetical protein NPIL_348091 [Nephila pilipes]